jgi:hypothetical protein
LEYWRKKDGTSCSSQHMAFPVKHSGSWLVF